MFEMQSLVETSCGMFRSQSPSFSRSPNVQSVARHLELEHASTIVADSSRNPAGCTLFHQKNHTAAAARATSFGGPSAITSGDGDELVDEWSGNSGCIGAPQLPFFAEQAGDFVPLRLGKCLMHVASNLHD